MSTDYPGAKDVFVPKSPGDEIQSAHVNNLQDAVGALETKVGVNNSPDSTSHDYKITNHAHTTPNLSGLPDVQVGSPSDGQVLKYNASLGKWTSQADLTGGGGSTTLDGLLDVDASSPTNDFVLKYESSSGLWKAKADALGASTIAGLTDAQISGPTNNQVLKYNSGTGKWTNQADVGVTTLATLTDVNTAGVANGKVLKYNSATTKWEPQDDLQAAASTLDSLTDVTITSPATDAVLKYDGGAWVDGTIGSVTDLDSLSDVTIAAPATNQVLKWSGTEWTNQADFSGASQDKMHYIYLSDYNITYGNNPTNTQAVNNTAALQQALNDSQAGTEGTIVWMRNATVCIRTPIKIPGGSWISSPGAGIIRAHANFPASTPLIYIGEATTDTEPAPLDVPTFSHGLWRVNVNACPNGNVVGIPGSIAIATYSGQERSGLMDCQITGYMAGGYYSNGQGAKPNSSGTTVWRTIMYSGPQFGTGAEAGCYGIWFDGTEISNYMRHGTISDRSGASPAPTFASVKVTGCQVMISDLHGESNTSVIDVGSGAHVCAENVSGASGGGVPARVVNIRAGAAHFTGMNLRGYSGHLLDNANNGDSLDGSIGFYTWQNDGNFLSTKDSASALFKLQVRDALSVKGVAGPVTNANFVGSNPPNNTIALDTVNGKLFAKIGGIWKSVTLT